MSNDTWHKYAHRLTPEQIEDMVRWDAAQDHPGGPDAHRRGMIAIARLFIDPNPPWWKRPFWKRIA